MTKRRSLKKKSDPKQKPNGPSRYELKQLGREAQKGPLLTAPPLKVSAPQSTPRSVPNGTERVTAKVSGIYLKKGHIFLTDANKRRIYVSNNILEKFDAGYAVLNGAVVECAIVKEEQGFRAFAVYSITLP